MKRMTSWMFVLVIGALCAQTLAAQTFTVSTNPVSDTLRDLVARGSKNLVGSAELMPAEKYSYHPTEPQMTFGQLIVHIVQTNVALCSAISDAPAPLSPEELKKMTGTDSKDSLVAERLASTAQLNTPGDAHEFAQSIDEQVKQLADAAKLLGLKP